MTGVFISVRRRLRSSSGRLLCICRECECDKGRGDIYEVHYCHDYYSGAAAVHWQGLAIAMATYIIYNYRDRSDGFVFAFGTFIGVAYEYICSVFTEIVFGKIFLGLPRSAVQPRWQNQSAVLLLLGHCGGGTVKEALSAVFKSD